MSDKTITILTKEEWIDFDDFEKSIKSIKLPLESIRLGIEPKLQFLKLQKSQVEFKDNIVHDLIPQFLNKKKSFLSKKVLQKQDAKAYNFENPLTITI